MSWLVLSLAVVCALFFPAFAGGYPNGTGMYVTDTGPFCASCHSAARAEYMPELPPEAARSETPEAKHYGLVRSPAVPNPYMELTGVQKEELIKAARMIDRASSVSVKAPKRARAGEEIEVTVKARGGNGPVVGVMLVDRAVRFQARPVSADGWKIEGEPAVRGQGGSLQDTWVKRRLSSMGLKSNLNFILVFDQKFDPDEDIFPEAEVTYRLRAPREPGKYALTAAFLYGTENTDRAAFFQRPSGRILFSKTAEVVVE